MSRTEKKQTIKHTGIVQKSDNGSVIVVITNKSACSGCHAEGSCTISGKEERLIEISGNYNVSPGDEVTVLMEQTMGFTALAFAYLIPLITVLLSLIILISMNIPELNAGVISLAMLIPYFTLLYLFRNQINKKFIFTLNV
jgi:positive regulator of sigma E activity